MAERHSSARRLTDPWDDPYDADQDWGSHEAANARAASRRSWPHDRWPALTMAPILCRLCEPGYVCHFHRED